MKAQRAFVLVLLVLSLVLLAECHSISLRKASNKFFNNGESLLQVMSTAGKGRRLSGNTIPLSGGLLLNGAYFMNITVGGTTYDNILLDTGSSNLVLPTAPSTSEEIQCGSDECNSCIPQNPSAAWASEYNCAFGQPICADAACAFQISYGGGALQSNGTLYSDEVCISDSLCATSIFGVSNDPPSTDGLIGFASDYNSCNPTCVPTPLDNYVSGGLTSNLFGLCLNPSTGGVLDVGETVSSRYSGEIVYAPMEVDRWFNLLLTDIKIGDVSSGVNPVAYRTTNDVIGSFVDSGTSLLICNSLIYNGIQKAFQNEKYCKLPGLCGADSFFNSQCLPQSKIGNDLSQYPDIVISIQGYNNTVIDLPIPATSYLLALEGYYCFGVSQTTSVGIVLGDVFMENYYIVFDRQNLQLGFANVADCSA